MQNYIWDFDGMLFDSYPHITSAFLKALAGFGKEADYDEAKALLEITFAHAFEHYDVSEEEKTRRLEEIIALQGELSLTSYQKDLGKTFEVLIEGTSKRNKEQLFGRNSQNKVIVFDGNGHKPGEYVKVKVLKCTSATLIGELV